MRSRAALVALALAAICFASVVSATETLVAEEENMPYHAPRVPTRDEERLDSALSDRASLLFRAMDKDHDKHIGVQDVKNSLPELERHMPGVHEKEFMAFLEMADKNGDKKLSYGELVDGLADGLDEGEDMKESASPEQNAAASLGLLETGAEVHMHEQQQRQRRGRAHHQQQVEEEQQVEEQDQAQEQDQQGQEEQISAAERRRGQGLNKRSEMRFAQRIFQQVKGLLKRELGTQKQKQQQKRSQTARTHRTSRRRQHRVTEQVKGGDDGCVMCQYILERCEANVKQSGVLASMASAEGFGAYLELDTKITPKQQDVSTPVGDAASFLETGSQQIFNDLTAATIIGSARQSTRVQRQLERQKYNEIYRIADLSLDDVCEQGMPNSFYGFCKAIYKKQSDVVDGLRYQYRAADICVRIGMCKGKYITKGIHSRYKGK